MKQKSSSRVVRQPRDTRTRESDRSEVSRDSASQDGPPRPVASGDIAPMVTSSGIQKHTVSESVAAAQEAKVNAVTDVMRSVPPHDVQTLAKVLGAIMSGSSPDDAAFVDDQNVATVAQGIEEVDVGIACARR